jgi:hypothetical protein
MCNCTSENLEIPRCAIADLRFGPSDHPGMTKAAACAPSTAVMLRASGASSTPRVVRSMTNTSGMLDRPVKPDDDSRGCGAVPAIAHTLLHSAARCAREFASPFRPSVKQRAASSGRQANRKVYVALVPKISKTTPCKVAWRSPAYAIPRKHLPRRANHLQCDITHRAIRKTQTHFAPGALPEMLQSGSTWLWALL